MRTKRFAAAVLAALLLVCMMNTALALSKAPSGSQNRSVASALAAIQTKTDKEYNEKIISGEFKQMMASIIDPLTNAEAMVTYYVGDCEDNTMRPAFFSVTRLQPDSGDIPTDLDYLNAYVWAVEKALLEREDMEFLDPFAMAEYSFRNNVPGNKQLQLQFVPFPIYEYQDGYGADVMVFCIVEADTMIYADSMKKILYESMFALFRLRDNLYGFPTDYCYLITDQDDVYEIMDILNVSTRGHSLGAKWMKWYR